MIRVKTRTHVYDELVRSIREQLRKKRLEPGDRILPEIELCDKFSLSRVSVRRALQELVGEGVLYRVQGKGTFVRSQKKGPRLILRLVSIPRQFEEAQLQRVIGRISERHPEVSVETTNSEPVENCDVVRVFGFQVPSLQVKLTPLDDFMKKGEVDIERFHPVAQKLFRQSEAQYAIPYIFCPQLLYYNKNLFDEAGIPYPDSSWDWAKLLDATRALTDTAKGQFGFAVHRTFGAILPFVWQNDGELFVADRSKSIADSPEVVEAFSFYKELESVSPMESDKSIWQLQGPVDWMAHGRVAMLGLSLSPIPLSEASETKCGVSHLPRQKSFASRLESEGFAIGKNAQNAELAWDVIQELTKREFLERIARKSPTIVADQTVQQRYELPRIYMEALEYSRPAYESAMGQVTNILRHEVRKLWDPRIPVEEICRDMSRTVNALLESEGFSDSPEEIW